MVNEEVCEWNHEVGVRQQLRYRDAKVVAKIIHGPLDAIHGLRPAVDEAAPREGEYLLGLDSSRLDGPDRL